MAKPKLTPAQEKFIAKFINPDGKLKIEGTDCTRSNRFGGGTYQMSEVCAAAIDFVFKLESAMQRGNYSLMKIHPDLKMTNAVMNFDRARYVVLALDSNAYMGILD